MKCREDRTEARMLKKTPKRYIQRDIPRVPLPHNTIPVPIFHHKAVLRTAFLLGQRLKTCSFVREYVVAMCRQCKGGGMCRQEMCRSNASSIIVCHPLQRSPARSCIPWSWAWSPGGYLNFFLPHQTHTHTHTHAHTHSYLLSCPTSQNLSCAKPFQPTKRKMNRISKYCSSDFCS